jgi:hypothetical protein
MHDAGKYGLQCLRDLDRLRATGPPIVPAHFKESQKPVTAAARFRHRSRAPIS